MPYGRPGVWVSQALSRPLPVIVDVLGLRRNVVVLSLAIFGVGLGEELWARFLPTYLEALGASVLAIGAFGTLQDLLEGLYPYPGGVLADRWGRKRALVTFNALALVGYGLYLVSPHWLFVFAGLACTPRARKSRGSCRPIQGLGTESATTRTRRRVNAWSGASTTIPS
jgi:MFS family permease